MQFDNMLQCSGGLPSNFLLNICVELCLPNLTGAGEFINNQFLPGRPRALLAAFSLARRTDDEVRRPDREERRGPLRDLI
jgi:hypothetical protein